MTSLDCLREELKRRGMINAQIESAVVAVVLDIVANSGDKYTKIREAEHETSKRLKELEEENAKLKKMFAEVSLENHTMKTLFAKKDW